MAPQSPRPYVLLSAAVSLDGCLDDTSGTRLLLSNEADFDRVDEVRAGVDAILVGANTVRADNPSLLVRPAERRQRRVERGLPETPAKVTITGTGNLDLDSRFFTTGNCEKIVYVASSAAAPEVRQRLSRVATVAEAGDPVDIGALLADLARRGIGRLLVEGGGAVHTSFLASGCVDELHLVFAPFFVGEEAAPRFARPAVFPQSHRHPMVLAETRQLGDVVFLRYLVDHRAS